MSETRGHLHFSIKDSGIGIIFPEISNLTPDRVFDSFIQCDGSTTRHYEGTGLGLSITKKLIENANGTIRVESTPDEGSCFTFFIEVTLPAKQTSQITDHRIVAGQQPRSEWDQLPSLKESQPFNDTMLQLLSTLERELKSNDINADTTLLKIEEQAGAYFREIKQIERDIAAFSYDKALEVLKTLQLK